ncbi:MAG: betaine--homocysteine S-methyltransferase [Acidiferrobacterales bacterium]
MSNLLEELLSQKEVVVADGAMGTNLFELGLANGAAGELWCVDYPDRVRSVHQGFVEAGADIILTNSFSANRYRFKLHRIEDRVREINTAAARVAREIADAAGRPVVVAGSMGPTGDILEPLGERTAQEAEDAFAEQAQALKEGGVDVAWIETMFAHDELAAAVKAAQRVGLPYVATMTFDTGGRTMMGVKPHDAIELTKDFTSRPVAFGANCGVGPAQLLDSVVGLGKGASNGTVVVAKSNCGIPQIGEGGKIEYSGTPQIMADYACLARDAGARIIGGCCGTTPAHLKVMVEALKTRPKESPPSYEVIERLLGPIKITVDIKPAVAVQASPS